MSSRARWATLGVIALVMVLRAPQLILEPRLFDEEASIHLAHAFNHGFLENLLFVPTGRGPKGYFQLPANLAAGVAVLLPLELAPVVATATAFLIQLLPMVVVLWGRSHLWSTPWRRWVCCAVLTLGPPIYPSVWLQTVDAQVFCGLTAVVLLCENLRDAGRRRLWTSRTILVFCGMSGVYTGMLAPVFLLRALLDRGREAWIWCGIVASSALVQVALYLATVRLVEPQGTRLSPPDWNVASTVVFVQHLLQPVLGSPLANALERFLLGDGTSSAAVGLACLAAFVALLWSLGRTHSKPVTLLLASTAVTSLATSYLAAGPPRGRYAVVSGTALLLALLGTSFGRGRRRTVASILVALSLCTGLLTRRTDEVGRHPRGEFCYLCLTSVEGRPSWPREVEAWQRDPTRPLRVWPYVVDDAAAVHLVPREAFRPSQATLDRAGSLQLPVGPEPSQWSVRLPNVPPVFQLVLWTRSDMPPREIVLEAVFEDARRRPIAHHRMRSPAAGEWSRRSFSSLWLDLPQDRGLEEAAFVTFRARSRGDEEGLVEIERIRIVPPVLGLLEVLEDAYGGSGTSRPSRQIPRSR